jgi:hypothetical protein
VDGPAIEDYLEEMESLFAALHANGVIRTSTLDDLREASGQLREVLPLMRMCDTASRSYEIALEVGVAETQLFLYDRGMSLDELRGPPVDDDILG